MQPDSEAETQPAPEPPELGLERGGKRNAKRNNDNDKFDILFNQKFF